MHPLIKLINNDIYGLNFSNRRRYPLHIEIDNTVKYFSPSKLCDVQDGLFMS